MTPLRHLFMSLEDPRIVNANTTTGQIELLQLLIRRIPQHIHSIFVRHHVCIISLNWLSFLEWRLVRNLQTISSKHFIPVHLMRFQGFSLCLDCLTLLIISFCVASCIIGLLDHLCHIFGHHFYHVTLVHDLHHIFLLLYGIYLLRIDKLIQIGVYILLVGTQTSLPLSRHNCIWLVIVSDVRNWWCSLSQDVLVSSLIGIFLQ